MSKARMEAFSDAVIAIVITIMVLELKPPDGSNFQALNTIMSDFSAYALSFVFLGIYWNNHHHLLHAAKHVNGAVLWANLHLLFWLSLIPFATHWMENNNFADRPVALYGIVLLFAAIAYFLLTQALIACNGKGSNLGLAIGDDFKGKISMAAYLVAIILSFVHPLLAHAIYILVAIMWFVPDRRIEKLLSPK